VEGPGKPHGQHSERPRNAFSVPVARCLALSSCSQQGVQGADSLLSVVVEEAKPWEGQTYWGDVSVQGVGGWRVGVKLCRGLWLGKDRGNGEAEG
jgi:hypothetical protein